jgi:hypothetical protein
LEKTAVAARNVVEGSTLSEQVTESNVVATSNGCSEYGKSLTPPIRQVTLHQSVEACAGRRSPSLQTARHASGLDLLLADLKLSPTSRGNSEVDLDDIQGELDCLNADIERKLRRLREVTHAINEVNSGDDDVSPNPSKSLPDPSLRMGIPAAENVIVHQERTEVAPAAAVAATVRARSETRHDLDDAENEANSAADSAKMGGDTSERGQPGMQAGDEEGGQKGRPLLRSRGL